jgi:hypothetical protein
MVIIALVALLTGCGSDPAATARTPGASATSPSPLDSSGDSSSQPQPSSGEPSASPAASAEPPSASRLAIGVFARVVADRLNVRMGPGLDAPPTLIGVPDAPAFEATIGTTTQWQDLLILDGPVVADGYTWFQVGTEGGAFGPDLVGWVAAGDGTDAWLVPVERCPDPPFELADLMYSAATWAMKLACAGGQELTLQGWYPVLPPGIETSGDCVAEPAWLICGYGNHDIRTTEQAFYSGSESANRLMFKVDPASGLVMPARGQWIEIVGQFDDPAAERCEGHALGCRLEFVVHEARAIDR